MKTGKTQNTGETTPCARRFCCPSPYSLLQLTQVVTNSVSFWYNLAEVTTMPGMMVTSQRQRSSQTRFIKEKTALGGQLPKMVLAALAEDPGLLPSTQVAAHNHL